MKTSPPLEKFGFKPAVFLAKKPFWATLCLWAVILQFSNRTALVQENYQVLLCPSRKELPLLTKAFQHQPSPRCGLHHTPKSKEFPEDRAQGQGCTLVSDWLKLMISPKQNSKGNPNKKLNVEMQTVRPTHFKNQTKAVQCSAFASLGLWKSILLLKDKHTSRFLSLHSPFLGKSKTKSLLLSS